MNTKKQAAKRSGLSLELINAVIDGLCEPSDLSEVYEHGAAAGYGKFIYYSDTVTFAEAHREEISRKIKELADDLGESAVSLMCGFNCLKNYKDNSRDLENAVGFYLYGTEPEAKIDGSNDLAVLVFNAAAWFALEEVARAMMEKD